MEVVRKDNTDLKLGIKHEKELRYFVEASFDAWQSGRQKPIAGDKAISIVRDKLLKSKK